MKRFLAIILMLILAATIAIFIFIPENIKVSQSVFVKTTNKSVFKFLSSPLEWSSWFPGEKDSSSAAFRYKGQQFILDSIYYSAIQINIEKSGAVTKSKIYFLPVKEDSLGIIWECNVDGGKNPVQRIKQYMYALSTKKNMQVIMNRFEKWVSNPENIYGLSIKHGHIVDSVLESIEIVMNEYPTTEQVYTLMQKLRNHYTSYGATQTGMPMLHVRNADAGKYIVLVAIPINKDVPDKGEIIIKHMFKGFALTADVTGGISKIRKSLESLEDYVSDYSLTSPAVPFQSIITDRINEPDSNKWVTKLYYPIY